MREALEYRCSEGHYITAPESVIVSKCPNCINGGPCVGEIVRIGRGSKSQKIDTGDK